MCAKFLKIGKYALALVGNMNETPVFFDMVSNKSFAEKNSESVVVSITAACGDHVAPMIIAFW